MKKVTVEGNRTFPIDMLRYDTATPRSSDDALKIESSFSPGFLDSLLNEPVRVELDMHVDRPPTMERWENFGWLVVSISLVMLSGVGCSYSRPYVTQIQPAGTSGLIIERCETEWNPLQGRISTKNCNQSYVQIGNPAPPVINSGQPPVQLNNNLQGTK